jgi:hypothetical protein
MGAAVITGYVLGRFHKAKWALGLAAIAGGKRLAASNKDGAGGAVAKLAESAGLGQLTGDLGGKLIEAGRNAAVTAASRKIESVTGNLHERSASLRGESPSGADSPDAEDSSDDEDSAYAEDSPGGKDSADAEDSADNGADDAEPDRESEDRPRAKRPARESARRPARNDGERRPARSRSEDGSKASRPPRRRPADSEKRERSGSGRGRGGNR